MTFPFYPHTSVGQVQVVEAARPRVRFNEAVARARAAIDAFAAAQARHTSAVAAAAGRGDPALDQAAIRLFYEMEAAAAERQRADAALTTARAVLAAAEQAAPAPPAPAPPAPPAPPDRDRLCRAAYDARQFGQAPAIIASLERQCRDAGGQPTGPGSEFPVGGGGPGASEFPVGPVAPAPAPMRNYLVPAIVVGAALLASGYLLTRSRPRVSRSTTRTSSRRNRA